MRPVVDSVRRKLRGLSKRYPGGVLKSAMQRLEQGDVVTVTQFPRLTHYQCAITAQDSEQGLLERRKVNSARHKAI